MTAPLAGIGTLLRASLRHEGHRFAPWILIATALSASSVLVYPWLFPETQERLAFATAVSANPALGIVFGPAFDLSTVDGFNAWRSLSLAGFFTALGAINTVIRSTRGQEDSGQAELLASGVLGRSSRLLAGVGLALLGSLAVGVVAGVVTGFCGGGWQASLLLGATFTASGWMFAGLSAVTAQLGYDARTAHSLAVGALGVLFLLRAVAYSLHAPGWSVWVNPLGWITETRPATGDRWWPLFCAVLLVCVCLVVAFVLQARRDFGQGVVAPRPGPDRGRVRSTWRLALRLNRGAIVTWSVAFVALGLVFGFFATSIHDILREDSAVTAILAAGAATPDDLVSRFLVTILGFVGIIAAVPGVQIMLSVRSEEMDNRVEPVLAGAVSRRRYYAGNVVLAFAAPTLYVLIAGLLIATLATASGIGVTFARVMAQAAATVPAVWTVVAVSVAVVGARPRLSPAAWVGVLASFALTLLGPTFKLPDVFLAISPFWHVPSVAGGAADLGGLIWVCLITALMLVVGFSGFGRRDLGRT
ncbi:ABC transporter permease [Dietzia sp. ANT_WB102]|uniref:ABC transporter permease n=1 Tax=Dietzia sp. ANT_WB102 TaxID=2597345 RepID=UPI0011EE8D81|nr:multidrug ABC transporter permease [Dietzia sp. ANT_WB102]KAA0919709.1 multidrug ABC transporter permease [Dietzia sp. ANT_WB102]